MQRTNIAEENMLGSQVEKGSFGGYQARRAGKDRGNVPEDAMPLSKPIHRIHRPRRPGLSRESTVPPWLLPWSHVLIRGCIRARCGQLIVSCAFYVLWKSSARGDIFSKIVPRIFFHPRGFALQRHKNIEKRKMNKKKKLQIPNGKL